MWWRWGCSIAAEPSFAFHAAAWPDVVHEAGSSAVALQEHHVGWGWALRRLTGIASCGLMSTCAGEGSESGTTGHHGWQSIPGRDGTGTTPTTPCHFTTHCTLNARRAATCLPRSCAAAPAFAPFADLLRTARLRGVHQQRRRLHAQPLLGAGEDEHVKHQHTCSSCSTLCTALKYATTWAFITVFGAGCCSLTLSFNVPVLPAPPQYAATKAFISVFGASLAPEVKPHGIDVLVFHPSPVASRCVGVC